MRIYVYIYISIYPLFRCVAYFQAVFIYTYMLTCIYIIFTHIHECRVVNKFFFRSTAMLCTISKNGTVMHFVRLLCFFAFSFTIFMLFMERAYIRICLVTVAFY